MAKDPAFLFYYQDFLVGIDDMSNEEAGAYIRCLCHQAAKGTLSEKHMFKICLRQDVFDTVRAKFTSDENGGLINQRLQLEINKRVAFAESRRNNRLKKTSDKQVKNISSTYVKHMENENEIENEIEDEIENKKRESKKFVIPTENEVYNFMSMEVNSKRLNWADEKITAEATKFCNFYESKGWIVGKVKMKSWNASARNWMQNNPTFENQNTNQNAKQSTREARQTELERFRAEQFAVIARANSPT